MKKKLPLLLAFVFVTILTLFALKKYHIYEYISFDFLKEKQQALQEYYQENTFIVIFSYTGFYILTTALSLPGAALLTLAGGALFGILWGTVIVSFCSTIGATFAFIISRYFLRDYVQEKFKSKLKVINKGIKDEGGFYLFALRLVPVFPFFVINILMSLTPIRATTFFWVSQLGMLAGTIAYINAGNELSQIESPETILSFKLILAFSILGILPLLSKWALKALRHIKILKKYEKPKNFDYNLVVIGAGSGGLVSAYIAATLKAKVALIEKHRMGGDCLNTGCVPSKTLIRTCKLLADAKKAQRFGLQSLDAQYSFSEIMDHVQNTIEKIAPHDSVERYTRLGVECFEGEAKIESPYTVRLKNGIITTRSIIVATGGSPIVPDIPGLDDIPYYTSDTIWSLREQPKHLLIIGGGPIGCELGQCFSRLGSKVTILQRNKHLLPKEDEEIANMVRSRLTEEAIDIYTDCTLDRFYNDNNCLKCTFTSPSQKVELSFDTVLLAIGRKPNIKGLGLESLDILNNGKLLLSSKLATKIPNIYACGDVAGYHQFTHAASHQAWYVSINALFGPFIQLNYDDTHIPWCTFTDPEIARIGLNEQDAQQKNIPYEITRYDLSDLDRAITDGEDYGVVKILTSPKKDKILGVTIVGSHAGEMITEFISAMKNGIGLNKILGTVHIYPTHSEANKYACGIWKKNHAPKKVLEWVCGFNSWRRH